MKLHQCDGSQAFMSLPQNKNGSWTIKDCGTADRIITLSVCAPDGGTIKVQKNPHCEIIDVKRTLQKNIEIPATSQLLLADNKTCQDRQTIFKSCITEDSVMEVKEIKEVELHIKCPDGKTVSLKTSNLCSIKDTIKEIAKIKNLTGNLSLWLGDKMIEEDTKLFSMNEPEQMELGINCYQLLAYVVPDTQIHLKVNSLDTIIDIKSRIQDRMVGVSLKDKDVISRCQKVDDSSSIAQYSVDGKVTFYIWDKYSVPIFVNTLTGKTIKIATVLNLSVGKFKDIIAEMEGCGTPKLMFAGRELQDECTLSDYNVQKESVIHVVVRFRGGAPPGPLLYVLDKTQHSVLIETYPYDEIEDVKKRIEKRLGIPPDQQELVIYDERIMGKRDEGRIEAHNFCLIL